MRAIGALVLTACSASGPSDAMLGVGVAGNASSNAGDAPLPPAVTGRHSATIELIAVTADGRSALTQDATGAARLWPTLDGQREPWIVSLAPAQQLALGRDGEDFVIAARDSVGSLEVMRIGALGEVKSRAQLADDLEVTSIAIDGNRVLAMRADHTLAIVSAEGVIQTRLSPAFGERLVQIVARAGRVLAIVEQDRHTYGRWLVGSRWGELTPRLPPIVDVMLSPDGTQVLLRGPDHLWDVVELAHGKLVHEFSPDEAQEMFGFLDEATLVAVRDAGKVVDFYRPDGSVVVSREDSVVAQAHAIGDGILIGGAGEALELQTLSRTAYLGYGFGGIDTIHVVGDQLIVTDGRATAMVLDRALQLVRRLDVPDVAAAHVDVVPLDDRYVLAAHALAASTPASAASIEDLETHTTVQSLNVAIVGWEVRYEPATRLFAASEESASFLVELDPATHKLSTWYQLQGPRSDVHVLDPAQTGGVAAIATRAELNRLAIEEFEREQLHIGKPIPPRRAFAVRGSMSSVDRRGRVYVWRAGDIYVYEHGRYIATLADAGTAKNAVVSPDGTHIAVWGDLRIRMYDERGTPLWAVAAPVVKQIAWLGGRLVAASDGGLALLDASTGQPVARQCGWSFALGALPPHDSSDGDSICEAR